MNNTMTSIQTVNVIWYKKDFLTGLQEMRSWRNDPTGVQEAEQYFTTLIRDISPESQFSSDDIDDLLNDDGYYESGDDIVVITHSF